MDLLEGEGQLVTRAPLWRNWLGEMQSEDYYNGHY